MNTNVLWNHEDELKKNKVVPVQKLGAYGESRGIAPLILNFDITWRRIAIQAPAALPSVKNPDTQSRSVILESR